MTAAQRTNLHRNTANLLRFADGIVQKNYLIQIYAIDSNYAKGIFDLLPEHKDGYTLQEIAEDSKTAHLVNKDPSFWSPDKGSSFVSPFCKLCACMKFMFHYRWGCHISLQRHNSVQKIMNVNINFFSCPDRS